MMTSSGQLCCIGFCIPTMLETGRLDIAAEKLMSSLPFLSAETAKVAESFILSHMTVFHKWNIIHMQKAKCKKPVNFLPL